MVGAVVRGGATTRLLVDDPPTRCPPVVGGVTGLVKHDPSTGRPSVMCEVGGATGFLKDDTPTRRPSVVGEHS